MKKQTAKGPKPKANGSQARAADKFHLDDAECQNCQRPTGGNSQQTKAKCQQQIEIMFELLRSAVFDRDLVLEPSVNVDWDKLMSVSQEHGLLAWVWDGICKLPKEQQPDRLTRIGWAVSAQELWDSYDNQVSVLDEIVEKCGEKGIRVLLLKGICLSQLYPKPQSRPSCDIDIYPFERCFEVVEFLTDGNANYGGKHFMFQYHGEHIECHDCIIDTVTPLQQNALNYLISTFDDCEQSLNGYYVLPLLSNTIFVLIHILAHLNNPGPDPLRIRSILDYGMLLIKIQEQGKTTEFNELLSTLELEHASDLFVRLSEWILQVNLSTYYSEAHASTNDVEKAKELLFNENLRHPIFDEKSFWKQLFQRIAQERAIRWRYSYLPSLERLRLSGKIRLQFSILVKSLLGLTFAVPLSKSIKEKRGGRSEKKQT